MSCFYSSYYYHKSFGGVLVTLFTSWYEMEPHWVRTMSFSRFWHCRERQCSTFYHRHFQDDAVGEGRRRGKVFWGPCPSFPRLSPGLLAATSSAARASLFLSAANWSALGVGPHHTSHSLANVNSAMEVICQLLGHVHAVLKYRGRPDATCFGFPPPICWY